MLNKLIYIGFFLSVIFSGYNIGDTISEEDLDMIKARGEAAMNQPEPADTSKRFEVVDLAEGSYEFVGVSSFKFKIEAGGVICGDNIDGSI